MKPTPTEPFALLAPLAADLREWRLRSGRPSKQKLIFPSLVWRPVDARGLPVLATSGVPARSVAHSHGQRQPAVAELPVMQGRCRQAVRDTGRAQAEATACRA